MGQQLSTNTFGVAKWVVSADATQGTHTTIAGAITSASSGDTIFIRPGTYTENLTLKAGVNLVSFDADCITPNVTISGTATCTYSGTVSCSGIQFKTNSAACITSSGSNVAVLNLTNCFVNASNNNGITSTNANFVFNAYFCLLSAASTFAIWSLTAAEGFGLDFCVISSGDTTACTTAATPVNIFSCSVASSLSTSSTGVINAFNSVFNSGSAQTFITTAGTGISQLFNCEFQSLTSSAVSVGTGTTVTMGSCTISSTNTNAITGAGTLIYSGLAFVNTSQTVNVTTQTPRGFGPVRVSTSQPAFLYTLNSNATNATGNGAEYTLGTLALTKVFDQGSNMTTGGTFTAPYTGKYHFNLNISVQLFTGMTVGFLKIITTARTHILGVCNPSVVGGVSNSATMTASVLTDMSAGDTATFTVTLQNGAGNTATVVGANNETSVSGYLVC